MLHVSHSITAKSDSKTSSCCSNSSSSEAYQAGIMHQPGPPQKVLCESASLSFNTYLPATVLIHIPYFRKSTNTVPEITAQEPPHNHFAAYIPHPSDAQLAPTRHIPISVSFLAGIYSCSSLTALKILQFFAGTI